LNLKLSDGAKGPDAKVWADVKPQQCFVIGVAFRPQPRLSRHGKPLIQVLIATHRSHARQTTDIPFLQFCFEGGASEALIGSRHPFYNGLRVGLSTPAGSFGSVDVIKLPQQGDRESVLGLVGGHERTHADSHPWLRPRWHPRNT
jgi:hypothetical protein